MTPMATEPASGREIIVVSGLPRSGTSMMMKMLAAGGVPLLVDAVRQADDDNPEGYFEFERVKQLDKGDTAWLLEAEGKAVKVISALLRHLPSTYTYRIIFVERDLREILASQRKMLTHRGAPDTGAGDDLMAAAFEKHLRQVKGWLAEQPHMAVLYVHFRAILEDSQPQASAVAAFLGQPLDVPSMSRAVKTQLYRNRQP
jgi:hypothetical protein